MPVKDSMEETIKNKDLNTYRDETLTMIFRNFWEDTVKEAYERGRGDHDSYEDILYNMSKNYGKNIDKFLSEDLKFTIFNFNKKQIVDLMNILTPSMKQESLKMKLYLTNYLFDKLGVFIDGHPTDIELSNFFCRNDYDKIKTCTIEYYMPSDPYNRYFSNNGTRVAIIVGCNKDINMDEDKLKEHLENTIKEMGIQENAEWYIKIGTEPEKYEKEIKENFIKNLPKEYTNSNIILNDAADINIVVYHTFLAGGYTYRSFEGLIYERL